MALTSQKQKAGFPLTYKLDPKTLPKESWVKMSQIRTLSTHRIGKKIGSLDPETLDILLEGFMEIVS